MRGCVLRVIVLLWLGWYLSGPLAATVDTWDGPRQEARDIQFNAGGGVVLLAAVFCFSILLAKKMYERISIRCGDARLSFTALDDPGRPRAVWNATLSVGHSPPFPIRI